MISSSSFVGHCANIHFVQSTVSSRSTARSIPLGSCSENWVGQNRSKFCRMTPRRRPLWLITRGSTLDPGQLPRRRKLSYNLLQCSGVDFETGGQESGKEELGIVDEGSSPSAAFVGSSSADSLHHTPTGVSVPQDQLPTFPPRKKRGRPKGSTSKKNVVTEAGAATPQATVCSASAGASSLVADIAAAAADPDCSGGTSISDGGKEGIAALGQPGDFIASSVPRFTSPRSSKESGRPRETPSDVVVLDDSPAPARRINIARAATAAKKNAVFATSKSDESSAIEFPINCGRQQRASGGGVRAGAGAGAIANSVVYTGRAFAHKRPTRTSRQQSWRTTHRDRGVRPPVEVLTMGNSGGEGADDRERQRMPLLDRAEVNAIMAASTPQGFRGEGGVFNELDATISTNAALLALLEDEDMDERDDFDELQKLDAEFAAVTPTGSGDVADSYRRDPAMEMSVLPKPEDKIVEGQQQKQQQQQHQQQEEEKPWQHALSLKDRLGLTDDEVVRLQASRRTGLGSARRLEERLMSRSAGGPKTGIGYLLGELRMKPEEVKEALMWWPPLLVLSERGAHAVAAWLQGGLGLSADDVCKMVKRNPAILSCSIVHNLRPKFGWLQQELGLSRQKSIRLIVRCPVIFALSIDDNMVPKVEWLETKLLLTRKQAARVVFANPGVLLSSVEGSLMPKIRWLVEALEMEEHMVFDMVRRYPMFFSLSSKANLEPKLAWLADHASSEVVRRVIYRQPSLLGHNAQGNLAPKVQWLQDRLGMSEEAAWKFVGKSPGFLTLSVSETLEPKLWWLRDKLEVSLEGATKILTTFPNLFHLSIETSLEPKLWWVRDALGLDRPDAAAILRRCPQVFGASLKDTLEPKLPWLAERLKTNKERIADIVKKYPQILMYSIERNLAPTIDFFEFEMGAVQPEELADRLEMKPSVLAASIEKRLLPRVAKMRRVGLEPKFSRDYRSVAVLTDAEFKAWMARTKAKLGIADRLTKSEACPPSQEMELESTSPGEHGDNVVSVVRGTKRSTAKSASLSKARTQKRVVNPG